MYILKEIDWSQIREELLQKEYEEDLIRLNTAYEKAKAEGDRVRMARIQDAINDL